MLCTFGPPSERKRHWILVFEDADVDDMHFDDEGEAMRDFSRASTHWNCTLLVTAELADALGQDASKRVHAIAPPV